MSENTSNRNSVARIPRTDGASRPVSSPASRTLEAVFASAMREAISPMAERWINSHEVELISALGPIFRHWMDQRLPKLVENYLKEELRRQSTTHS